MVFVKVRETYDLHTITGKMSVIGIHTPKAGIIKRNYPGLLMQCKTYRPVSCDVRIACASMLPADPLQVGVADGDIAPEDLFNPILYKAMSNLGMSQLEARINAMVNPANVNLSTDGDQASVKNDGLLGQTLDDEFNLYYGLLADTNSWRHANPQSGLSMSGLKPLVYEMLYTVGDNPNADGTTYQNNGGFYAPAEDGSVQANGARAFKGYAKPMPFINTTIYNAGTAYPGFSDDNTVVNAEGTVPAPQIYVGAIIIPPSKLHQLYYRMVVEWTLEFSSIRSVHEITTWTGLAQLGSLTHYIDYDYTTAAKASGVEETKLTSDTTMVSANVEVNQVM